MLYHRDRKKEYATTNHKFIILNGSNVGHRVSWVVFDGLDVTNSIAQFESALDKSPNVPTVIHLISQDEMKPLKTFFGNALRNDMITNPINKLSNEIKREEPDLDPKEIRKRALKQLFEKLACPCMKKIDENNKKPDFWVGIKELETAGLIELRMPYRRA
jgi:hypothetical protein